MFRERSTMLQIFVLLQRVGRARPSIDQCSSLIAPPADASIHCGAEVGVVALSPPNESRPAQTDSPTSTHPHHHRHLATKRTLSAPPESSCSFCWWNARMGGALRECCSGEELRGALEATRELPDFLNAHYAIRSAKEGWFPEIEWRVFFYEQSDGDKVFFVSKQCKEVPDRSMVMVTTRRSCQLDEALFWQCFDQLHLEAPKLFQFGVVFLAFDPAASQMDKWFKAKFPQNFLQQFPTYLYYMNESQRTLLSSTFANGVPLPEEYCFDEADDATDGQTINDTWIHAGPNEILITKAKIRNMPSSLVRVKATSEPVAFELTDPAGFMNHLFTISAHRKCGLGTAVEQDLSLKLMAKGIVPYKCVELFNTPVLNSTAKNPYWTRWEDASGEPVEMVFHKFSEEPLKHRPKHD